jgi:hypothetical protein
MADEEGNIAWYRDGERIGESLNVKGYHCQITNYKIFIFEVSFFLLC